MALVCPACGTENRSVAKFCIECIGALPAGFEATQLAPRPAPREAAASDAMPSALAAFAAPAPLQQPKERVRAVAVAPPPETKGRKGLWVSVGALAIALLVGAAGWAAAGAGGWYIYKASNGVEEREAAVTPPVPTATAITGSTGSATALAGAPLAESVSSVASTLAPGEVLVTASTQSTQAGQDAPSQAEGHPGTPAPARLVHKPQAAAPAPAAASSLAKACSGMNFFAAARCKVTECARPALRQTSECRVVQAQQRLMEEKRNPTLAN